eukprot:1162114-Pelagomonas_calceolata.AAC.7
MKPKSEEGKKASQAHSPGSKPLAKLLKQVTPASSSDKTMPGVLAWYKAKAGHSRTSTRATRRQFVTQTVLKGKFSSTSTSSTTLGVHASTAEVPARVEGGQQQESSNRRGWWAGWWVEKAGQAGGAKVSSSSWRGSAL